MAEGNNPRNPESSLFKRLTRLFSGPIVNYRSQLPRQLKRSKLDNYARKFRSMSGQQFKKSAFDPFTGMSSLHLSEQGRSDRYSDFDQMEYTPEIASALDIYADEMTTSTSLQPLLALDCQNSEIKAVLDSLYHNILQVDYNLFGWCRTMCKYGDFFLYLDLDEEHGIKNAIGLPSPELQRIEGEDPENPNYVQFQWESAGMTLENWQVSHFRILGNDKYAPYGTSALEPARRIWRQLTLIEDAMMAYRIVRSPERRVFYVDVGNISPQDVEQYMQKVMTQMKRNQVVDADTGRVDLRYNPMSIDEDYFIPTRGQTSSRVESLPGGTYTGDIDDVKYLRDKLFAALKIPQSYLSRGEGGEEDKATLAQKDIRFARTVQRLQRVVISELEKIGVIHLYTLGYRGEDLLSFKLGLNNPSRIAELQELEHWRTKFDIAGAATEGFFSKRWVAINLLGMSDEEFLRMQRETYQDKKFEAFLEKAVEDATAEAEADAAGGDDMGGDDMGGDMGGDLGGDLGGDMGGEDEGGDEGPLLAEPGGEFNRDDRRDMGARKRSYRSHFADEFGRSTDRNTFKGMSDMMQISLSKGIYEKREPNYPDSEEKILSKSGEVQRLIEELKKVHETKAQ